MIYTQYKTETVQHDDSVAVGMFVCHRASHQQVLAASWCNDQQLVRSDFSHLYGSLLYALKESKRALDAKSPEPLKCVNSAKTMSKISGANFTGRLVFSANDQ